MKRKNRFSKSEKLTIFNRTHGHCHFCGDELCFDRRGRRPWPPLNGQWEIDHIFQVARGGDDKLDNNLPICSECNSLRWFRSGKNLREILRLGLIAKDEMIKKSELGNKLVKLNSEREIRKQNRRTKRQI